MPNKKAENFKRGSENIESEDSFLKKIERKLLKIAQDIAEHVEKSPAFQERYGEDRDPNIPDDKYGVTSCFCNSKAKKNR